MPSLTEFPWSRMSSETQQRLGERLRVISLLLYTRLPLLHALGIGLCFFLLPYVLWWFTSSTRVPIPPRASEGLELHQLLQALQAAVADPTLGQPSAGAASSFTPKDVEIAVHFVIQPSVPPSGDTTYRLVPVDTALQSRPEHVQTLTMRLTPTLLLSQKPGAPMVAPPEVWPPRDGDPLPPARLKKRAKS
jgi:hypothetical protein